MQSIQGVQKFVSTKFLATRRGTIVLGIAAAALAAIVLIAYLNQYRDSVSSGGAPVSVLVASKVIEVGTPGEAIRTQGFFEVAQTSEDYVKAGALTDPAYLTGMVAVTEVAPGQQLTTADFQATGVSGVGAQLEKNERAVAVPVDTHSGLTGRLLAGDRVDIYAAVDDTAGEPVIKLMMQNVYVLEPPTGGSGGVAGGDGGSNVLLRVTPVQAAKLTWVTEHGQNWLVLRPRLGAKRVPPATIDNEDVLTSGR
jgi:Flp pilus assembly protein CpaB